AQGGPMEIKRMATHAELKAKRAKFVDALEALNRKLDREGENAADILLFEDIKSKIAVVDGEIERTAQAIAERAARARALASPVATGKPRLNCNLRSFKDTTDKHGRVMRADESAYRFGQWFLAGVLDNPRATEFCRNVGIPVVKAQ